MSGGVASAAPLNHTLKVYGDFYAMQCSIGDYNIQISAGILEVKFYFLSNSVKFSKAHVILKKMYDPFVKGFLVI